MKRSAPFRPLVWLLCAGWCLLFLRCETTEKSMVRAIYAADNGGAAEVILWYQDPEAQADASEAAAALQMTGAEGETLEKALAEAEKSLPQTADYRLCDHLIVPQDAPDALLERYEQLVLTRRCGRTAARVSCSALSGAQLLEKQADDALFPDKFMEKLKQNAGLMPRLYQHREALLLPLFREEPGGAALAEEAVLFTPEVRRELCAEETEMARLLTGSPGTRRFWLEEKQLKIRRCSVSVTLQGGQALLRLDCQLAAGEPEPTDAQRTALQALAEQTVRDCWQSGADLLSLGARRRLQGETTGETTAAKNACPEVRADVRFLGL